MKILVTGGAGFIGSWIIRHLLYNYPEVSIVNLDLLTYTGNLETLADITNVPDYDKRYEFVHGDILNPSLVNNLFKEVDACLHVAAQTHVDNSLSAPELFTHTNVLGTQVLLEAMRHRPLEKFVLISTDEVYGSLALDDKTAFNEESQLKPSSPYSASKAGADMLAQSYFASWGLPICITRCSNNYGPYQYPEKLIPFFILKLLQGSKVPLYGDGLNVRDWIHARDHAAAVAAVLFNGKPGDVYNVGADNEWANIDITRILLKAFDQPETWVEYVSDRPGHDRRYAIDATKIKRELGWAPQTNFETGIQETIDWYRNNTQWINHVLERRRLMTAEALV